MTTSRILLYSLLAAGVLSAVLIVMREEGGAVQGIPAVRKPSLESTAVSRPEPGTQARGMHSDVNGDALELEVRQLAREPTQANSQSSATAAHVPDKTEPVGASAGGLPEWAPRTEDRWRVQDGNGGDLRGRDWAGADLAHVDLSNTDLRGADLTGAKLLGASLRSADLAEAMLATAVLLGADLRAANLPNLQLGPMNISAADLREANLRGARLASPDPAAASTAMSSDFSRADLRDFDFGSTRIDDAVFDNADLRGANLAGIRGRPKSLHGAQYDDRTRLPPRIDPAEWSMVKIP